MKLGDLQWGPQVVGCSLNVIFVNISLWWKLVYSSQPYPFFFQIIPLKSYHKSPHDFFSLMASSQQLHKVSFGIFPSIDLWTRFDDSLQVFPWIPPNWKINSGIHFLKKDRKKILRNENFIHDLFYNNWLENIVIKSVKPAKLYSTTTSKLYSTTSTRGRCKKEAKGEPDFLSATTGFICRSVGRSVGRSVSWLDGRSKI